LNKSVILGVQNCRLSLLGQQKSLSYFQALSLTAWPLIRDTAFYSVALILLVVFFVDNKIFWWEALILFLWYGAYVLFMKFNVVAEASFLSCFPSLKAKVRRSSLQSLSLPWSFSFRCHIFVVVICLIFVVLFHCFHCCWSLSFRRFRCRYSCYLNPEDV
jgi:Ca2+/Na+ antiporter